MLDTYVRGASLLLFYEQLCYNLYKSPVSAVVLERSETRYVVAKLKKLSEKALLHGSAFFVCQDPKRTFSGSLWLQALKIYIARAERARYLFGAME